MTKQSGLGDNFYISGYDLSGTAASVDTISTPRDVLDTTSVKQFANSRIYSARNGSWSFTTFFESTPTVTTPGVPASGTAVTNTYLVPVYVTVTGGTGTNVLINGVAQGSFDGTYTVPAGGTISLTYTVAPTWNWFALGSEHSALIRFPSTDQVANYFRGTGVGNAAAAINCKQLDYDWTRDTTGNLTAKVDLTGNSFGMEWGIQLTSGIRTDTTATAGPFYDNGAAFAFGAQAYLQIFALVGTSIDVAIQHATTSGGSYSTIIDFGSVATASVPYAARASVSNTTTIDEFLKVTTTGTFSFAQFAVMINVNPVAGVVF
jgi:hypothetical protein